jgi:hypothetical protein
MARAERLMALGFRCREDGLPLLSGCGGDLEAAPLCAAQALEPDIASAALESSDPDHLGEPAAADGTRHHFARQVGSEGIGLLERRRRPDLRLALALQLFLSETAKAEAPFPL